MSLHSVGDTAARTKACLDTINSGSPTERSNVIVLIGRVGSGKSSLLEDLTFTTGYADTTNVTGTTTYQIEETAIDGKRFLIMDTPGFEAGNEWEAFQELHRSISAVCANANVVGILYVSKVNSSRIESLDKKLSGLVQALCGQKYFPALTFVTTHWTAQHDTEKVHLNRNLQALRNEWANGLNKGAKIYHHGRRSDGDDEADWLSWYTDRSSLAACARDMIAQNYCAITPKTPRFAEEIDLGKDITETDAARYLRACASGGIHSSRDENFQKSFTSDADRDRKPPPTKPAESSSSVWQFVQSLFSEASVSCDGNGVNFNLGGVDVGRHSFSSMRSTGSRGGDTGSGFHASDPNSVVDHMKFRGMNSSFQGRVDEAARRGITVGSPGSAERNTALLRDLKKRPNF